MIVKNPSPILLTTLRNMFSTIIFKPSFWISGLAHLFVFHSIHFVISPSESNALRA